MLRSLEIYFILWLLEQEMRTQGHAISATVSQDEEGLQLIPGLMASRCEMHYIGWRDFRLFYSVGMLIFYVRGTEPHLCVAGTSHLEAFCLQVQKTANMFGRSSKVFNRNCCTDIWLKLRSLIVYQVM
jgi:hypothetical protein